MQVADHSQFLEVWEQYIDSFNNLAEKMLAANIDIAYLKSVIDSVEQLERLSVENYFGVSLRRKEVLA